MFYYLIFAIHKVQCSIFVGANKKFSKEIKKNCALFFYSLFVLKIKIKYIFESLFYNIFYSLILSHNFYIFIQNSQQQWDTQIPYINLMNIKWLKVFNLNIYRRLRHFTGIVFLFAQYSTKNLRRSILNRFSKK